MSNPCELTGDDFRYAPVLTLADFWEAGKIALALSEFGVNACAVGGNVIVAWEDVSTADNVVVELHHKCLDIDWSKVRTDWAEKTSFPNRSS